jgi:propanol-preferring alcohol dehydrogenase
MKAILIHHHSLAEKADLRIDEAPIPTPSPGQVRIEVLACGVCRTDLHILEGDIRPPRLPIILGHQVVGRVVENGPGSDRQIGSLVGVPWLASADGTCDQCRRGSENLCPNARFTGFHVDGGYAEYTLADARYVLPIPDGIDPVAAAPLLCAGLVGYRSLKLADIEPGERVGLVGFGASAHLQIQVLRHWGCEVFVFTRSESHQEHAHSLGAVWAGDVADSAPAPLDRAVIFAPAGNLIPPMLAKIRPGGTLAVNAVHMSPIPEMPYALIYGERTLRSVANATYQDGVEFLKLAAEIPVRADTIVYPLADAGRALLDLKESRINGEAVLRIASK